MTIVTVVNSNRCWGYDVTLIKNGREKMSQQAGGAGNAAALAMTWKARYKASKVIGDEKIMGIING